MLRSAVSAVVRNAEEIVAGTFTVLMCLATLANVVARYVFNAPIPWAEELARYAFIWLVFIGAALCSKHRRHVGIDVVVMALPERGRASSQLAVNLATAALMLVLIYYGWILTAAASQPTSTLGMPTHFVYVVVPLSALLILVRTLIEFRRNLRVLLHGGPQ